MPHVAAAPLPQVRQLFRPEFPLDQLAEHPQNPNLGDVGRIEASLAAHGFVGVIVAQAAAQPDGRHHILAGNHRHRVLVAAGAVVAPVMLVELSDQQALQFMLVDNRTGQAATTDEARLADVLADLFASDALEPSGFTADELDALNQRLGVGLSVGDLPLTTPASEGRDVTAVRMTLTFARERVTPEVEAAVKDLALLYGGRYAVRGLATDAEDEDGTEP